MSEEVINNLAKDDLEERKLEENKSEGNKLKDNLVKIVKLLAGLTMLAFVVHWAGLDSKEALEKILQADRTKLLIALFFVIVAQFLGIKRWQILAHALRIEANFLHVTKLHFVGLFCNNFLPSMGGDVVKAMYLTGKEKKHEAFLSIMLDRYVGLLVILLVASIAAFSLPNDTFHQNLSYATWAILLALIIGGLTALLFSELVAQTMERFKNLLEKYKKEHWPNKIRELSLLTKAFLKNYYVFGSSLLLSILAQGFAILAVHQLSIAVGAQIDASTMFVVVPIVLLISVLPISIGGLGTREVAFVYLLTNAYVSVGIDNDSAKSAAALVAFLWLAINLLVSLPGAISYSMINNKK
ncbi:MAG: flippase-like domain-containing protein [Acidobacteria bacterium]|nr:flippase-like domain-containing protein [Acidobacteriota bacterium]